MATPGDCGVRVRVRGRARARVHTDMCGCKCEARMQMQRTTRRSAEERLTAEGRAGSDVSKPRSSVPVTESVAAEALGAADGVGEVAATPGAPARARVCVSACVCLRERLGARLYARAPAQTRVKRRPNSGQTSVNARATGQTGPACRRPRTRAIRVRVESCCYPTLTLYQLSIPLSPSSRPHLPAPPPPARPG